jgi:uncharacterized membrane protein
LFFEVLATPGPAPESGFGADYTGSLLIHEVRRAEAEGWGCREDLSETKLRAFGVEPFWSLVVRASGMTLSRPDPGASVEWPPSSVAGGDGTVTYSSTGEAGVVEVVLIELRCVDAMAGSHFAWEAEVRFAGETLVGCAVAGDAFQER